MNFIYSNFIGFLFLFSLLLSTVIQFLLLQYFCNRFIWLKLTTNLMVQNFVHRFVHFCILNMIQSTVDKFLKSLYLTVHIKLKVFKKAFRSIAQLVEHRSPKPGAGGSNPSTPAMYFYLCKILT